MSENTFERIEGRFAANNKVHGRNAKMIHNIRGNEIGFIGGDAFSGNTVSTFPP
ncbi:hypothetical protein PILCRDRAFT_820862 [Piloderma croceum F 1598]|uniref:Uncharacterized protein n=1 Tax=Piloderma croceum (strain F 1598) TaxID=765440 RepID=A0A0C3B6V3_PILCF|nr:hypothetical protein PILCRDRAFT_830195 [Piloderma croceum F 1598]KIM81978.1 hypothetical protein PILCRDRAFT_820862 [Piloderma croceum F 1598]